MKSFFKYTFATVVGIIFTSIIGIIFFFIVIGSIISAGDKEVKVKPKSVLKINLSAGFSERTETNPLNNFDFNTFESSPKLGLNDILKSIKNAATDDNIKGIYIDGKSIPAGIASVEEIRDALIKFKESNKFIISFSDFFSLKTYYLASVADKVYLNPQGEIDFKGLRSEVMFYKGALEKMGIEPQVIRHGKFKSAVEPFLLDKMSDANKEQTITYVGSIWNHILKGISNQRNITIDNLNIYADDLLIRDAKAAVKYNMIDSVMYKDQIIAELERLTETKEEDKLNIITLAKYSKSKKVNKLEELKNITKDKVAIIYATGQIDMGAGSSDKIGSDGLSAAIREARLDTTVKSVVLRVNSPGGSALASEVIWREMVLLKAEKPVVVSMGDVAASGGYYIACPADVILASEVTITGSIGVFGVLWNAEKLLNNKLGLTVDGVQTNKNASLGSLYRPLTAEERAVIQHGVEDIYDVFIGHVAEGRNTTPALIDSIGQGRVWSGENAKEINLVDEFGGLERAIEIAIEKANLEDYAILELPKQEDPIKQLLKEFTGETRMAIVKSILGNEYKIYKNIQNATKINGIQTRLPYDVEIY